MWQKDPQPIEYGTTYIQTGYSNKPTRDMAWLRLGVVGQYITSGEVIDIGYGDGEFVRQALKAEFDAKGFDVHYDTTDIPTVKTLPDSTDCLTFFDSIEHFDDLQNAFTCKARLIVVTVPHTPSVRPDELITWRHYKPNEHLHYFTPASILSLFARNGYYLDALSNVEDLIRKNKDQSPNTTTYIFREGK